MTHCLVDRDWLNGTAVALLFARYGVQVLRIPDSRTPFGVLTSRSMSADVIRNGRLGRCPSMGHRGSDRYLRASA